MKGWQYPRSGQMSKHDEEWDIANGRNEFKPTGKWMKDLIRDDVNNPRHYTVGGYEALDVIKAKLTPEEFIGAMKFNVLKYLMRANYKGHHDQDCEKAQFYAKELCNALTSKQVEGPVSFKDAEPVREEGSDLPPF
jgi:hypothetical protein